MLHLVAVVLMWIAAIVAAVWLFGIALAIAAAAAPAVATVVVTALIIGGALLGIAKMSSRKLH